VDRRLYLKKYQCIEEVISSFMDQGEYQMEAEIMEILRKKDKKVNSVMLLRSVAIRLRDNLKLMFHNSIRR